MYYRSAGDRGRYHSHVGRSKHVAGRMWQEDGTVRDGRGLHVIVQCTWWLNTVCMVIVQSEERAVECAECLVARGAACREAVEPCEGGCVRIA